MKTWRLSLASLAVAAVCAQPAQAVVGYYNRGMNLGVNLIANQLLATPDNTLNSILNLNSSTPDMVDGTAFTKWYGTALSPTSFFDADSGTWSINYSLDLGEGGWLYTPSTFNNIFVGEVGPYINIDTGQRTNWNPNYADGLHLISDPIPMTADIATAFTNVVGRLPRFHESVWILDEVSQQYVHSTFNGVDWDTALTLSVGQAAFFDLGPTYLTPPEVPEPSMLGLTSLGAMVLLGLRRRR